MSRVDVVVPCYKYAHFLRESVTSVLTQEGVDVRVLIIDDCSPDNTPVVAAQLCREDSRVAFRRHEVNQGHIRTYNEGLDWFAGDYCVVLSADDKLTPGALGRATRLMDAHSDIGMVYGKEIVTSDPERDAVGLQEQYGWELVAGRSLIEQSCTTGGNLVPSATVVMRTSIQRRVGGYDPLLTHSGDMEMWLRCAFVGSIGAIDAYQAYYRKHSVNMSHAYFAGHGDLLQRKMAFEAVFRRFGEMVSGADDLHRRARAALCELAFVGAYYAFERGDSRLCGDFAALALEMQPRLAFSPRWVRLRLKRAAGPRIWAAVRPAFRRLLGRTVPT